MTVIERVALAAPQLFEACAVNVLVPAVVGVPLIAPVEEFSDSPAGRAPPLIAHVKGAVPFELKVVE